MDYTEEEITVAQEFVAYLFDTSIEHLIEAPRWCGNGWDGTCLAGNCTSVLAVEKVAAYRRSARAEAEAELTRLRAENVELQNGIDGYARQLEARKAEIAKRDALIGRLVEGLRDLAATRREPEGFETPRYDAWEAQERAAKILADPDLAPPGKP